MSKQIRVGILGASGYSGCELLRYLLLRKKLCSDIEVVVLTGSRRAGEPIGEIFPHFSSLGLPDLVSWQSGDWGSVDVAFCALPHGMSHEVIGHLLSKYSLRVIDLSADFRLRDFKIYERWYGRAHGAMDLQGEAVYGLSEFYGREILGSRLIANPGCYATAAELALLPIADMIEMDSVIIDAKSGITGAGRSLREDLLFSEVQEDFRAYSIRGHRHVAEVEQVLSDRLGVIVEGLTFVPHLLPVRRGIFATIYARLRDGVGAGDCRVALEEMYGGCYFVEVLGEGCIPSLRGVRGTNRCLLNIFEDRRRGGIILCSVLDNLGKGAAGQAVQNMNLMLGLEEGVGFVDIPLVP